MFMKGGTLQRKMSEKSQKFVKIKMFLAEKGGLFRALKM